MITVEKLNELGCNTSEGLERCFNDEEFYLGLIPEAFSGERYKALDEKVKAKDLEGAFEEAHAIKGVLANLALTPLYDVVSEITELLRSRTDTDYSPLLNKMWDIKAKFDAEL